jgi:alpha-L-rhamnosidase
MFSVDYDRVLSGYVSIKVRGPAGTIITIEPAETKIASAPMRPSQVTLGEGETVFEYPGYDSFSTIRVTVSHATGPVEFADVRATFVSQPVSYRGSFEGSDEALNRLWKASRWLTQICMQNRYLDSPHNQEPLGDTGDSMIESLENFYAFDEPALTRQDLRKFAGILDHFKRPISTPAMLVCPIFCTG